MEFRKCSIGGKVYHGEINDKTDIVSYWENKPYCFPSLKSHILQSVPDMQYIKYIPKQLSLKYILDILYLM